MHKLLYTNHPERKEQERKRHGLVTVTIIKAYALLMLVACLVIVAAILVK
jgi:hypothetical protein